jgi:membrane-associated protease RseP (regulator of RpoE activity)
VETVLLYIGGVLVMVVGLAVSIGLHEFGHLIPAKLFGVRVGQWMIGFGPTLFSKKVGETEYGVKAVPLGGYISMAGMYPPERRRKRGRLFLRPARDGDTDLGDLLPEGDAPGRSGSTGFFDTLVQDAREGDRENVKAGEEHRTFWQLSWWKRIIIMLGGPVVNLILGVLITGIVLCGFGIAGTTTTVGSVSKCVVPQTESASTSCAGRAPSPAADAGVKPGDRLVSLDGTKVTSWEQATAILRRSAGDTLTLVVERDGAETSLSITPIENTITVTDSTGQPVKGADGKYETQTVGFVGIGSQQTIQQQPVTAVVPYVWGNITHVGNVILNFPQRIVQVAQAAFGGQARDPNGPIGVVGVGRLAGEVASVDAPLSGRIATLLSLLGSLNIALFVFNLVPLLPLDGGHVIGALWEAIRRRGAKILRRPDPGPVDIAKLLPLTMAVAVILGGTSVLLLIADIVNPVKLF